MILFYCDDAGNTGRNLNDPSQPYHYLAALAVPEAKWKSVEADYVAVLQSHLPHVVDRAGHVLPKFELHGTDIWNRKKPFHNMKDPSKRADLLHDAVRLIEKHGLHLVYGRCDKPLLAQNYVSPAHPHWIAAFLCLERVARYATAHLEQAVVIADQNAEVETLVKDFVSNYRRRGPPWGRPEDMSRVLDNVHFVASYESPHMQLCDCANFLIARHDKGMTPPLLQAATQVVHERVWDSGTIPY